MTKSEEHAESRGESRDDGLEDNAEVKRGATTPARVAASASGPDADGQRTRPARSGPLVWLAMLIALMALGLASYPVWADWLTLPTAKQSGPSASEFEQLADRVATIRQESTAQIEGLRAELNKVSSDVQADSQGPDVSVLAEEIDQLSVRVERLLDESNTAVRGLRTRLEKLEAEVGRRLEQLDLRLSNVGSDLGQADHDISTRLLLMEIDSLFAIAQNHLVLSGDGRVALQSWERAMERLTTLDGADFQQLKEAARREFMQLQEYRPPDLGAQIERLFTMADSVAGWPVNTIQPAQPSSGPGSDDSWRARLSRVAGRLVRVESVDRAFLAPDEIDVARARVRSALHTAALAMARSRPELARSLIGEAAEAAQPVFDSDDPNVSEALGWLADFAAGTDRVEPPEVLESRAEISRLLGVMQ